MVLTNLQSQNITTRALHDNTDKLQFILIINYVSITD